MESIYEQMNKIDDRESLNEKYNVRTHKDVKKLQEHRSRISEDVESELQQIAEAVRQYHREKIDKVVTIVSELNSEIDTQDLTNNLLDKCVTSFTSYAKRNEPRRRTWAQCNYDFSSGKYLGAWYPTEVIQTIEDKIFIEIHVSMKDWIVARPVCVFEYGENTFRDASKSEYSSARIVAKSIRVD